MLCVCAVLGCIRARVGMIDCIRARVGMIDCIRGEDINITSPSVDV